MLLKSVRLLITWLMLSIALSCSSTAPGPNVTVCLSDVKNSSFDCSRKADETTSHIPWASTDNFVCMAPDDFESFVTYLRSRK